MNARATAPAGLALDDRRPNELSAPAIVVSQPTTETIILRSSD